MDKFGKKSKTTDVFNDVLSRALFVHVSEHKQPLVTFADCEVVGCWEMRRFTRQAYLDYIATRDEAKWTETATAIHDATDRRVITNGEKNVRFLRDEVAGVSNA